MEATSGTIKATYEKPRFVRSFEEIASLLDEPQIKIHYNIDAAEWTFSGKI